MKATFLNLVRSTRAAIVLAVVAFAGAAFAQSSVPADAPPSKAEVQALMEKMRVVRTMSIMMDNMRNAARNAARESFLVKVPNATPEQLDIVQKMMVDAFSQINVDEILEDVIPVYQKHYSRQDVQNIVAFYDSPTGQKVLNEQPAMMQEINMATIARMQAKMTVLMKQMDARMDELMATTRTSKKPAENSSRPPASPPKKP